MGWYVSFVAFNRPPEIDTLQGVDALASWRLFHEPETGAWFLEGQSNTEAITFQEEIKTKALGLTDEQTAQLKNIETRITEKGGDKSLFDADGAKIAMGLSRALDQPVAHFSAYDEGGESGFIFDGGKLVRGRLEIDWNKALAFDADGKAELDWLYPEGVSDDDPDFVQSRTFFQIGLTEADAFFERHTLADALTFDQPFKPGQFVLKAQKGEPDPLIRTPHEELTDVLGQYPTQEEMLETFTPVVDAILDPGFPDAPNPHRHDMDSRSSACSVYVSYLRKRSSENAAVNARLHAFLLDLSNYAKALRPAPDFRKSSTDFRRWQRKLSAEWQRQKSGDPWFRRLLR
ncbi:MAG: hypothetical protein AAFQ22_00675 [Pseudomonadota bacterium]